ncbi:hypothetical protein [Photobacterium carnosum]|uniref:Uncharacterized protein n=1 Tax=Photobacterium carnosum TaxID=2023717 RepID=A0A2N4ULT2_9GAMM|nr:hypothetical protein [Photobacterium carnosum]PLC55982.1 hypothetical protein CIK00_20855 [Photobacterium carnosum]
MNQESLLEFHFEYNQDRRNPSEVFHALGYFIEAYTYCGRILADAIDEELDFDIKLEQISDGSIRAFFKKCFIDLISPDQFLNDLQGEISTKEQIEHIAARETDRLKTKLSQDENNQSKAISPQINSIDVALLLEKLSAATENLQHNEKISIGNGDPNLPPTNVITFDPKFRYKGKTNEMFNKNFIRTHDGEEVIDVLKSYFRGDNMWQFENQNTKFQYNAVIEDKKWLNEFHNGTKLAQPTTSLRVHSCYEVWKINGQHKAKNAKIIKVIDTIEHKEKQHDLI